MPSPSGPRWAIASVMDSIAAGEAGRPDRCKAARDAAHRQPVFFATMVIPASSTRSRSIDSPKSAHQPRTSSGVLTMRVLRRIPVEIDVVHFFEIHFRAVVCLEDVPVEQPLEIDATRRNIEKIDRLRDVDFDIEITKRLPQLAERHHCGPAFVRRHVLKLVADIIVSEFADRALPPIDIEERAAACLQVPQNRPERDARVVGVMKDTLRKNQIDAFVGERKSAEGPTG